MRRRITSTPILFCTLLVFTIQNLEAMTVYDFSSGAGVDRFAYGVSVPGNTVPPLATTIPLVEFSAAEYSAAALSDDVRYTTGVVEDGCEFAATRFVFTITEPLAAIEQLDVLWEGSANEDPSQTLRLWNAMTATYVQVGSQAVRIPLDGVVAGSYTTNAIEFVEADNTVTLLVVFDDIDGALFTDYVSVAVTTTGCGMDSDCDDGIYCNGVERCVDGFCQPGSPVDCDDGDACTDDSCNEITDSCDHVATVCDDEIYCNGIETCDPVAGCLPGTPPDCDDGIPCTFDTCNEFTAGCDHVPEDAACDNGVFCDGTEFCDPVTGCQPGTPVDCDDGIACTIDTCNEAASACGHIADGPGCMFTNIRYVDPAATGINDGTNWENAYTELRDALSLSQAPGNEIWVAAGTYTPAPPDGSASATFLIPSGVAVYGGFVGGETALDQRDPALNVTILSGDIDGNDTSQFFSLPNSHHVVTMDSVDASTRLDGFEIRLGYNFSTTAIERSGAGLYLVSGDASIVGCYFVRCVTERGGAVYVGAGNSRFESCTFNGNIGSDGFAHGGAANIAGTSTVSFVNCEFLGNEAEGINGHGYGGAIYSDPGTVLTVDRCRFFLNVALNRSNNGIDWSRGGAIYCQGDTFINHSTFDRNVSNVAGAIQSWGDPPLRTRILNCTFHNNDAISTFINGQEPAGAAGGIAGGGELEIIGTVVHGGFSDNYGGAWVGAGAKVSGSIFWNNTDNNGSIGTSNIRPNGPVEYGCVQGMLVPEPGEDPPDPLNYPGSISADPMFVNGVFGDFRLQAGSPCIDAGDKTAWPVWVTTDLDGNPRYFDDPSTGDTGVGPPPAVDMGAYEFGAAPVSGDVNCDGTLDFNDTQTLVNVLIGADVDPCHEAAADMNNDGAADGIDISQFLDAILGQ